MTLTNYPKGSLRELIKISIPLMIASFSSLAMVFVDRLLLAHYSLEALNATVNASTLGWAFIFAGIVMTSIDEVFVAQYNGAGLYEKIGSPVWQMIWLSIGSFFFFIPLSLYGTDWIYHPSSMENIYFRWMLMFAPSFALYGALCGFFVGRGKVILITILSFVANVINGVLDIFLIFGFKDIIPPLGVVGAVIATCSSQVILAAILFWIFLKKENRDKYHTGNFYFDKNMMSTCIRIGLPIATFAFMELLGWAAYYYIMTKRGEEFITIAGICQSIIILFIFFLDGMNKGVTIVTGNLIGSKELNKINRVISSGSLLTLIFFVLLLFFVYFYSEIILHLFILDSTEATKLDYTLQMGLYLVTLYLFVESIRMVYTGILTAGGDTKFLFWVGISSIWILMVLPVYLIVLKGNANVQTAMCFIIFYSIVACVLTMYRFYSRKWLKLQL